MYPRVHAATNPDKPALIMAVSGEVVTYRELDGRSCRLARLLRDAGLRPGDHAAIFMENHARYFDVIWAALRSGLYLTPVSSYLTPDEAAYVVNDCQARALVTSTARREVAERIVPDTPTVEVRLMVDGASGAAPGHEPYDEAIARYPDVPLEDEPLGDLMFYSSGTTGRPKGIKRPLTGRHASEGNVLLPRASCTSGCCATGTGKGGRCGSSGGHSVGMSYQEQTTLMTVANRLEIGDLTARYNRALETGDLETWIGTFVQEGVLQGPGESFAGHRELIRFFRAAPPDRIRVTTDAQVEVDGVHARQECRFLTLRPGAKGVGVPEVEAVGRYRDVLVYERGRWYFSTREMVADLSPAS